jgi:glycosyltransferase involved in cell wall biosynthesis
MRILFLSHYYPPEVNAPATRTSEHCIRWARAGHDVTVVTCVPNCPTGAAYSGYQNRLRPQVEYVDGVRVVRVWTFLAANAGARRRIVNFLSYLVSAVLVGLRLPRPDVVVATSPQFFCGWAGVLVAWLRRIPFVLEIRDIWPESIQAVGALRGRLFLRLLERLERWMYRAADHIVAVGAGYRDRILLRADVADRISVITNGVDPQRFTLQDADAEFLRTWRLDGRFVCSYIGTIGMAHGLEVVLEAAKLLERQGRKDICFCLVGDGSARQRLESEAHAAGLDELVIFTGQQPKDRIPAILASSNACLVHLKKCELFETVIPSKIFETMAMGRPIIMGVRGPARDIVLESDAGLAMDPESAESLVATVTTLADNPQLTSRLGHSARQRVLADFNRDVLAGRFLRLMEAMTGEPGTIEFSRDTDQSRKAA